MLSMCDVNRHRFWKFINRKSYWVSVFRCHFLCILFLNIINMIHLINSIELMKENKIAWNEPSFIEMFKIALFLQREKWIVLEKQIPICFSMLRKWWWCEWNIKLADDVNGISKSKYDSELKLYHMKDVWIDCNSDEFYSFSTFLAKSCNALI